MLSGKQGGRALDTFADILADARRGREEALKLIVEVGADRAIAPGMTKGQTIEMLHENIANYAAIIKRLG